MGFCQKCNQPINVVDGKKLIIYDDEFGVSAAPCFPCNEVKVEEKAYSCPKCYEGFDDYLVMERHYFNHYKDLLNK